MRLFPGSLLWRAFLLIAVLMVLSVLAWAAIFDRTEREPRARQLAQMVASVVNLTRAALVTARPEKRRELLLDLADREGIRVYPAEVNEALEPLPDHPMLNLIAADIRDQLGTRTRVATEREGIPAFWVSFRIDEDEYWVMLPRERIERVFAWQWLGWGSAALLLALSGAYLIMFRVTRPLQKLAGAATEIGRGRTPPPLEEGGANEISTVAHAFNQMSRDLARLDSDRALILAGISHDLRTPLARLRLSAEMSGADDTARESMVSDIEEMDKIIGQFLDFARDPAGEPTEPTDLNALVADVVEQFRKHRANLETDLAELPRLLLRPLAMRRLVSNLINNALRHGGGDGTVEVRTRREEGRALLEVLDRGPGISVGESERLKQPFTRLEEARTGAGGAGLGLSIVDRVARGHGGSFDLLPRDGGGLIARASIPIQANPA